jgi:hypothetical protein
MKTFTLLLLLFLSSCAAGKKAQTSTGKVLTVSFSSVGSGIDYKSKTGLDKYIEDFQQREKATLPVNIVKRGKEGEQSYCIELKQLSPVEQTKFIDGAKQLLSAGKWIAIQEKENCQ